MMLIFKIGNYGVYAFANEYDPNMDIPHNWGYKIWWKDFTPRIEETLRWSKWNEHAKFTWELRKRGQQFDGFTLEGPLIQFKA